MKKTKMGLFKKKKLNIKPEPIVKRACDKIYARDPYAKTCIAKIVSKREDGDDLLLQLDRTIFAPEGGGQPSDVGTISLPLHTKDYVSHVFTDNDGVIWHRLPGAVSNTEFYHYSTELFLDIDWDKRFDNMQRHCGEHILSGAAYRLFGAANKGFHMGEDYMTVDLELPKDYPHDTLFNEEMLSKVEYEANLVIWQDLKVSTDFFATKLMASTLPVRKQLNLNSDITIVTIGDVKNPADCVACCGTHPSSTGQVGLIKIYKAEPNKGMTRIYFEAGKRAFKTYQEKLSILNEIERRLSAGDQDVLSKYDALQSKNNTLRNDLYTLKNKLYSIEAEKLLSVQKVSEDNIAIKQFSNHSSEDINGLIKHMMNRSEFKDKAYALTSEESLTVFLFAGDDSLFNAGEIVKLKAKPLGAKGGGNKTSARAIFQNKTTFNEFLHSF